MSGWIKLHRKILNSDFYEDLTGRQRDVIITLLLMADHEPREWKYKGITYRTNPGQVFTSIEKIRKKCGKDCTRETVYKSILKAEENGFITRESNKTHTLITIENWELYQNCETDNKQVGNTLKTEQTCFRHPNKKKEERIYNIHQNSEEFRLSHLLFSLIRENNPKAKEPRWEAWCKDMDKIMRIDKRSVEDIEAVIRFSQKDNFWHKNILSVSKLRKQFDRLYMLIPKSNVVEFKNINKEGDNSGWNYI